MKLEHNTNEPNNDILISVVIPSYNEEKFIERCLESVLLQEITENYEVIVVDSSSDSTVSIISNKFSTVRLFHFDQKMFPGAARNEGVKQARGKIVAFLDAHCIADIYWLGNGLRAMKESGCLVVGGSLRNGNSASLVSVADYILAFNEFSEGMPSRRVEFMPTCNLLCTKSVFDDVGGFEGGLRAGEDTMFCYMVKQKGYSLYFDAGVVVSRFNRETLSAYLKHHYTFGGYSAQVRRKVSLPGSVFVRFPILTVIVPFVRTARIFMRLLRQNRRLLLWFLLTFPLVFIGICAWSVGFIKEAWTK